ncbi:MAG: phosphoribosylaminoimidazolesuccinocarboxamide synthase [Clostridium sp.]|nr:phosphoribosylaminoimidazolesuccinocarboxamide synthase [Bacteroides sp.]MCM1197443.1 phosphoribosylaminoimidazolesuccinocarboxamide synthase [Clostridium sp.]
MEKKGIIYNGESVKIYATEDPALVIQQFTDKITAFNKIKKAAIREKGKVSCGIASLVFRHLAEAGIKSHFERQISDDEILCRRTESIPVEVIVRNVIAGSMAHRLGLEEGIRPANTIYDICYKNDNLSDPLINDHHAVALGLATYDDLKTIYSLTGKINTILCDMFRKAGIELVDFKIEFGRLPDGEIILSDEITPDSARLWDIATGERLDKDRFRRDLGRVGDAYRTVYERLVDSTAGH